MRSLKHEALEQYLAVQEVRRSAQISLVAEVASAYLTLQADRELLKISQDTLKIQQDAVQMVERSKKAGGMAQIDMHRAQTQLETARVGVEQYTRQVAQDENALAVLVGTQLPADLPPPQPFANTSFVAELRLACRRRCWNKGLTSWQPNTSSKPPTPISAQPGQPSSRASR